METREKKRQTELGERKKERDSEKEKEQPESEKPNAEKVHGRPNRFELLISHIIQIEHFLIFNAHSWCSPSISKKIEPFEFC